MSVGAVIFSKASTPELRQLTEACLDSLMASHLPGITLEVVVIEQEPGVSWAGATTLHHPEEFHYNRFANIGVRQVSGDHLLICNNDLTFDPDALQQLHAAALETEATVSPRCPLNALQRDLDGLTFGVEIGRHFSGWCFLIARKDWELIGGFDEAFPFWYADNSVVAQLTQAKRRCAVVPEALVTHHASQTLRTLRHNQRVMMTRGQRPRFERRYSGF